MPVAKTLEVTPRDEIIGLAETGGMEFTLYHSLGYTVDQVGAREPAERIVRAYRALTGDQDLGVAFQAALDCVRGDVQIQWYQAAGKPVPQRVIDNQRARLEAAPGSARRQQASETAPKGKSGKPLKIKDLIIDGLLSGTDEQEIIRLVHQNFPDAKTGPRDIAFYRYKLRKSGQLKTPERGKKK